MSRSIPARRLPRPREWVSLLFLAVFTTVLLVAFLLLEASDLVAAAGGV